jgi:hypothetical protein
MRVQAQKMLKNPHIDVLCQTAQDLIDIVMNGCGEKGMDDVYEIVIVRTPQPSQSPLALAAGLPTLEP